MSFPVLLHGPYGEHHNTYATTSRRWPLGTQLIYQDGRKFRFSRNGAVAMVAARTQQAIAPLANHLNVVQTAGEATAVGARSINLDIVTAQDFTAALYNEGFINVSDGTGEGYIYKIASHDTNTAEDTVLTNFVFQAGDSIQVATGVATDLSILKHPNDQVIIFPTTATSIPVGVSVEAPAIDAYCWLQTRGPASVLTNGTLVVGEGVFTGITTAGAVTAVSVIFDEPYTIQVGFVMHLAATTEHSTIFLTLDG